MVLHEFTVPASAGHTQLHAVVWLPEGAPKAVLQISHGVSEYILRYAPFAKQLTERGFAVVGHDHLGHGGSVAKGAPRLYFGPKGSWFQVTEDLYTLRQKMGSVFPGLPYFLMGHSMGSFLARTYLIRYPGTVNGAILMGTGQQPAPLLAAARAVTAEEIRRVGEKKPSPLVEKLAFGAYNRQFAPNRTKSDWLSRSRENVDRYLADPLCGGTPTTGLFREMLFGIAYISKLDHLKHMNLNTPILFISGAEDPVGENGKGVRRAYQNFQKVGVRSVELRLLPGLRHEILNEACGQEIGASLCAWMEALLPETQKPL